MNEIKITTTRERLLNNVVMDAKAANRFLSHNSNQQEQNKMNKLTKDYLDSLVVNTQYVHQDLLTICTISLKNGFKLVGTSACADEQNYDAKIGEQIAYQNAFAKLWELEGYLLKQRLREQSQGFVALRNGNQAQIVYTSPFGKLLVVEQTGDELPKVHWHNADGSYHKDEQNQVTPHELDIIWEVKM